MTTLALPAPRLIGADLLKLRRRRGLRVHQRFLRSAAAEREVALEAN